MMSFVICFPHYWMFVLTLVHKQTWQSSILPVGLPQLIYLQQLGVDVVADSLV